MWQLHRCSWQQTYPVGSSYHTRLACLVQYDVPSGVHRTGIMQVLAYCSFSAAEVGMLRLSCACRQTGSVQSVRLVGRTSCHRGLRTCRDAPGPQPTDPLPGPSLLLPLHPTHFPASPRPILASHGAIPTCTLQTFCCTACLCIEGVSWSFAFHSHECST